MDEFFKMDVFFVVATAAAVVVALCLCVMLAYATKFLRTLDRIAQEVEGEAQEIREDLDELREEIRDGKNRFLSLFSFFGKGARRVTKHTKRRKARS
jgi:hypothetical protein